ncbi:DUF5666 domain-containing protein [Roseomonas sp. CCTCC AB2023176]|uniref:DUF5666 domain-containing protein n=1 Tax=Roseomonas sp. CCTCC AB2023176 TaxID=3342640 RepID=UPI0035E13FD6
MTRRRDTFRAIPAAMLLAAGCAPATRRLAAGGEEGGIGGTGISPAGNSPAGNSPTGIFGTVTALGSLYVNGLRVETPRDTVMDTTDAQPVLPGDTVAVEATREGDRFLARRVTAFHPLIGPVEPLRDGRLAILGTPVVLGPTLPVRAADGGFGSVGTLRPGQPVAVSGLWRGDAVVATALRPVGAAAGTVLRGQLRRDGFAWRVGATRLRFRSLPFDLPEEAFVTVRGRPEAGGLAVESLEEQPLAVFAGRIAALSVEGFGARNRGAPGFHLAGFGLPLDPESPAMPAPGERRLFLGRYGTSFRVAEGLALPPDPDRRAALLEGAEGASAIRRWLART